jgi:hypothetical protein
MHRAILATLLTIVATSSLSAQATNDPRRAKINATIERSGTKADWINQGNNVFSCRLVSFIPLKLQGQKAVINIDTLDNGKAIPLKEISFKVNFNSQISKHVNPDVVLQVEDDAGQRSEQRYTMKDIAVKDGRWTLKFDSPKKIRHIFIGGQQLQYRKEYSNLMGALDFTFYEFRATFGDNGKPMNADVNTSVRVINPDEDPLLESVTGTIESENPK